jgi:hypothetical protein
MSIKQVAIRSASGVATRFLKTPVVKIRSLTENQLLRVFDDMQPTRSFHLQGIAIIDEQGRNQTSRYTAVRTLKAVMVSPDYWAQQLALHAALLPSILVSPVVDSYLLIDDRFNRVLSRLPAHQDIVHETLVVGGPYTTRYRFTDSTVRVSQGVVPVSTSGATQTVTFGVGDAGTTVVLTYVTAPLYNVLLIARTADQPTNSGLDSPAIGPQPLAYLMDPALATALGISIPALT